MEKILVIDFGSQYTKLIAKTVRELEVYSEIVPFDTLLQDMLRLEPKGIILSGGPASVYEKNAPGLDRQIYELGVPILGICYGMQLLARDFGGEVVRASQREYGISTLQIRDHDRLLRRLKGEEQVWMSHGDIVKRLPEGFKSLASTPRVPHAAMKHEAKDVYGIQFHPEVVHTSKGKRILRNFLFEICRVEQRWDPGDILEERVNALREQLKSTKCTKCVKRCIMGVSGGVDSSTAAVLVHEAVGDRLIPIFVDTGLMRKGEGERVKRVFAKLGLKLRYVDARRRFLSVLKGVVDPEEKRKRVGEEFVRVFEEEAKRLEEELGPIELLVQGTIYSDVIESAGVRGAEKIKSHHNVGGLPQQMNLRVVEPLRELFKDEVRRLAERLGIPHEIAWEQPFPGPGLAVRIIGEITEERVRILQEADQILREEMKKAELAEEIWQYFPVLLPVRSVAIMGDGRGYGYVVAIRAIHSVDGMTADWFKMPYELLESISSRIVNEVPGVTRVVYDITSKPPGTIEWE